MDKLLKLEKYQLLHNSIYWCGMIGILILGFFTADTYVTEAVYTDNRIYFLFFLVYHQPLNMN